MISVLISKTRTPEEQTAYLAELRSWLEGERDTPVEEMSSFFAHRLDQYEGVHLAHWAAEYEALADYLPDGLSTLLDIGCGTGLELASLLRRFPDLRVTGIDLSAPMLEKLRQNYPSSRVETICADYFSYPFEGRQYDAALSFETLHHFPYQKKREIYRKLYRAVRSGGCYLECDYLACCQEEEDLCLAEYHRRRQASDLPEGAFVHIDIPLTLAHQTELLTEAGFARVELLYQNEGTALLRAERE